MFKFDAKKVILPLAGIVLTVLTNAINTKTQDEKMKETVSELVAKELAKKGES